MPSQFELDMHEVSGKVVAFVLASLVDKASDELQWIKDHSAPTEERDALLAALSRDWEAMIASANAAQIEARITALRDAAIRAGPSQTDKALLRY